ncbi:nuclear transport factor 2 family protein [Novosphingobium sp. MW5]|nr:nuclear transport factor 2 family protein [Novosphingobium sp. MW5]
MEAAVQALIDKEAIRDCVARLARGEDRRQPEVLSACFWPDSTFDYAMYKGSFPEYLAWVTPGADAITNTQHVLGQTVIDLDGDTAKAETYVISYHRVDMGPETGERDTCIGGRYLDSMEKRDGKWAIAHRTMLYDWYQDWGASADWSTGIMGYPFHGPNYTGRVKDDASVAFFAGKPF